MNRFLTFLYRKMPKGLINFLGKSALLGSLRDKLLRPKGEFLVVTDKIDFEGKPFIFQATFRIFEKARAKGIEKQMIRNAKKLIHQYYPNHCTILDIGANFGFVSLALHTQLSVDNQIISFEPHPTIADILKKSVALNGFHNIKVENMAVGDEDTQIHINIYDYTSNIHTLNEPLRKQIAVQQCTIDQYVQHANLKPDFIKIDVDGYEQQVLEGMTQTIQTYKPIIIVETNGMVSIITYLSSLGYAIVDANLEKIQAGTIPEDIFCIPKDFPPPAFQA